MRMSCGFHKIQVRDKVQNAAVPVAVLYPTCTSEQAERFGRYSLEVAVDAPVAESDLPVVVLSHGNGGIHSQIMGSVKEVPGLYICDASHDDEYAVSTQARD